jgi:hypothetical protein
MWSGRQQAIENYNAAVGRIKDDAVYYGRRALQEQVSARRASCAAARDRHDELASMYRFRVAILSTRSKHWADVCRSDASVEPA